MGVGRRSRWAIASLAVLLYWLAAHSLRPLVTIRLDELGATDAQIALTVAAYSVFSLLLAIPGGRLVDRVGVMRVLVVSLTAMVLVGVGYALATTPEQIIALQAVNGVVELGVWLALQALASHAGGGEFLTRQLALFSLAWGIGLAVGPALGGAVYGAMGFQPLGWLYAGVTLVALAAVPLVPYRGREQPERGSDGKLPGMVRSMRVMIGRPAVKGVLLASRGADIPWRRPSRYAARCWRV